MNKKDIKHYASELKKQIGDKGYVSFALDTREVTVEAFLEHLKSENLWFHVTKKITLENQPIMAFVVVGYNKPVEENITAEEKEKMMQGFLKTIKAQNDAPGVR